MTRRWIELLLVAGPALGAAGCSEDGDDPGPSCAAPGGAVTGAADTHCTVNGTRIVQPTDLAECNTIGTGEDPAGGDELDPFFGTQADDDQCKYHVTWSTTPVCANDNVTLTAVITSLEDNAPVTDADPDLEVFLSDTHLAPNVSSRTTEGPPGTYTVTPVRFDASGRWTVRWHLFEDCMDASEESPHGHVAFYMDVP